MEDNSETLKLLLELHSKFGTFEGKQETMSKSIDNLGADVREVRNNIQDVRKEFREDLMGLENEVKNLNGFRNRVVGVASAVSAAAAFVMSVVDAYVTKKL